MVKSHPQMGISELWEAMQMGSQTVSIRLRRKGETTRWRWLNMHSIASVFWKAKRDFIRSAHHWASRLLLNRLLSRWLTNTEKMKCWSSNDVHCHHPLRCPFPWHPHHYKWFTPSSAYPLSGGYHLGDEQSFGSIIHLGFIKVSLPKDIHSTDHWIFHSPNTARMTHTDFINSRSPPEGFSPCVSVSWCSLPSNPWLFFASGLLWKCWDVLSYSQS